MAENVRAVAIGGLVSSMDPDDVLVTYGLGSCVAVCLYDPLARAGGMLHALLPQPRDPLKPVSFPARFVGHAVTLLVEELLQLGASSVRLQAVLCGGARMISGPGFDGQLQVGRHNVLAAAAALQAQGIPLRAQDTGGRQGRTVRFYLATGRVTVRTMLHERVLT